MSTKSQPCPECGMWSEQVREGLRVAVTEALEIFGTGFLSHPDNAALRQLVATDQLQPADYFNHVLRLVYRLLFLMVAEERRLIFPKETPLKNVQLYVQYYSVQRLRRMAATRGLKIDRFHDAWLSLLSTFRLFEDPVTAAKLGMSALAGELFHPDCLGPLASSRLSNASLFDALDRLSNFKHPKSGQWMAVNFGALATEEFGSVYENLLELHPIVEITPTPHFGFKQAAGNERKTSGSYYTPSSLVDCLLDSALDPVLNDRIQNFATLGFKSVDDAILALKVCDPACGSGHFLIAAAQRIARRLAIIRAGDEEPGPELQRHALREVIGHCIYGVDINPMSVELCKVGLWIEALEPGMPLSFLDHHIQRGNSLFGTTPILLEYGIPDDAFVAIEGDIKARCAELKKQNKRERGDAINRQKYLQEPLVKRGNLAAEWTRIDDSPDDTPAAVAEKERRYAAFVKGQTYQSGRLLADTWCATFVWNKDNSELGKLCPTERDFRNVEFHAGASLLPHVRAEIERLRHHYQFFHWHLAFPDVFRLPNIGQTAENEQAGWCGGFDVVLGNPPWDTLSPDQREFFGEYVGSLRSMAPDEQQTEIAALLCNPTISTAWKAHCRDLFSLVHFLKNSGVYKLYAAGNLGKGDFNIYRMFVEAALRLVCRGGFLAMVVPGGLYGGANASAIRQFLFDECELRYIFGLINTTRRWFEKVDIDRFAAFAARCGGRTTSISTKFGLGGPEDLTRASVEIDAELIRRLAPETYAIPDVRNASELTTSRKMYAACPTFGNRECGPPFRHYSREVDMGNDRGLFTADPTGLPVYEGRMINHFDHRAKTYQSGHGNSAVWIEREFGDSAKAIVPQWRVLRKNIPEKLGDRCDQFRIAFGDVANPRNQRSFTATLVPPGVICGHTVPTFMFDSKNEWAYLPWLAVANTFTMDSLVRRRLSSPHMTFTVLDSLPFPRVALTDAFVQTVAPVVLRLVCTSPEMTPFWNRMAALGIVKPVSEGCVPPTALVDPSDRDIARAELEALIAVRIFSLTVQELSDLLDTFEAFRRSDEKTHSEFRTKRLVLNAFERLSESPIIGQQKRSSNWNGRKTIRE